MGRVEGTLREGVSVLKEIFLVLGADIQVGGSGIMLFNSGFQHFLEDIGRLLAVVTVTVDGSQFAYRVIQQGSGHAWLILGLLQRLLLLVKGICVGKKLA